MFPVGALTKPEVRAEARRLRLTVADKADSQEICFVPDGDYASFRRVTRTVGPDRAPSSIRRESGSPRTPGCIVSPSVSGRVWASSAQAPLYVLKIDADSGDVTVGPRSALDRASFTASGVNWIGRDAVACVVARDSADSPSPSAGSRTRARDRRRTRGVRVRRAAARCHAGTGRCLLRRRHRHGRRLDRLSRSP